MDLLLQRIVDGLSDGAIYGLVALAVVLVYRSTGVLNFAQGEMGMFCAFIAWRVTEAGGSLGLAIIVGVVAGFVLGGAIERVVMRPFEGGDHLRMTMVTVGVLLVVNALAGFLFTTATVRFASPFGSGTFSWGGVHIEKHSLGVLLSLAVVSAALWALFTKSNTGIRLRAASQNPESSQLLGINVGQNLLLGWGLAGAMGALAAMLIAPTAYLSTSMMSTVILFGFTAAIVGGLDSSVGAVVGGLGVGLLQNLVSGYVPFVGTQLQLATALVVVLVALLVRPQGLFGRARLVRV